MSKSVFNFRDYKAFIEEKIASFPNKGWGIRSQLAEFMNSQTAFISQVLNGNANLSLEQAEKVNEFFDHTRDESHYFLLLVQYARAGTSTLQSYFEEQMRQILEARLVLKNRLDVKQNLSREDQAIYYSAWYYAAIHILLTIPKYRTPEAMSRYLDLPVQRIIEVLEFLASVGLAEQGQEGWKIGSTRIHLSNDSPMISKHHTNWRMKAIQALEKDRDDALHYSSCISISRENAFQIKSRLIKEIEECKQIIWDSKEEELYGLSLDFFKI
jgi:uncharacterized protein (TIGR02147 family)